MLVGWDHLAIGLSLLSGLLVRVSAIFGIGIMLPYRMAHMDFPFVGDRTNSCSTSASSVRWCSAC